MPDFANERLLKWVRTAGVVSSALTIVVAIGVLLGWETGNQSLKSVMPGLVAMNPVTAICFIVLAAALLIWGKATSGSQLWVPLALTAVVTLCGLVRLGAYLSVWDLPVDRLVFASRLDTGGVPNRMAPNTAFNFCLLGLAFGHLLFGHVKRAHFLALGAVLTAFIALIGYAYSVTSLVRVAAFIPMALHTAVLFLLMAAALLWATPEAGLTGAITSSTAGGRVIRRMLPTLVLVPPVLGWLRLQGELAGFFGPAFGVAMFVGATVAMGMALTWLTAKAVDRGEAERRRADEITLRLAHFDSLTGLPNRLMFEDRLRQALARARRAGGTVALLFLDLDGFKKVNDILGHAAGDQVLKQVAQRMETALRSVDTAARLGGDEFTIVLEQIKNVNDIEVVAQRLLLLLSQPYLVAGTEARLSASVGVSIFPTDGQALGELLSQADAAMYRAKRAGKNQVAFHAVT